MNYRPKLDWILPSENRATELILHRTLEMRAGTVSAKNNAALRAFYKKMMDAQQSPVVLMKQ